MGLFKKTMTWEEPKSVRKKYYPYPLIPFWSHIVFFSVIVIFIVLTFLIFPEGPLNDKLLMLGIGVFMAAFFSYGIRLIDSIGGTSVRVGHAGIERMDAVILNSTILSLLNFGRHHWKWRDIAYLYLYTEQFNEQSIHVIEIVGHDNEPLGMIGLPVKEFKMDMFLAVLEENNCPLRPDKPTA